MSTDAIIGIDFAKVDGTAEILPQPPSLSSHQYGWKNIHIIHLQQPPWEVGEIVPEQHTLTVFSPQSQGAIEIVAEGKTHALPPFEPDCLLLLPAEMPFATRWDAPVDTIACNLDAEFLKHLDPDTIDPDRVALKPLLPRVPDPLVCQIILSLVRVLTTAPEHSNFYAESLATALGAHLLKFYATDDLIFREYRCGLPQHKLKYAIEYIDEHLSEDISLAVISSELDISPYYLCRLFKQSVGITPHAYLIQQRIEKSKQLLKQKECRIIEIAIACGFANPSHFARAFRQQVGVSPKQFRIM